MKQKIEETFTDDEIVSAMVLPVILTAEQRKSANKELTAIRVKRHQELNNHKQKLFELRRLRFQLEEYIHSGKFYPEKNFGYFLSKYITVADRKQKEFAEDIHIHRTTVTNLLKNKKKPNQSLMIRLEIHSGSTIPAIDWYRLYEMERGYEIINRMDLREKEQKFVKHTVESL